jgi:hypothetical protein
MNSRASLLLLAALALLAISSAQAQTVEGYGIAYTVDYTQTVAGSSSLNANPYSFSAFVEGPSLSGTYTFTHGGSATSPQAIPASGIFRNFEAAGYPNFPALSAAYADSFSLHLLHTGGPTDVTSLSLASGSFPTAPALSGGTWSGGKLLVAAGSPYTLNFNSHGTGGIGWNNVELYIDLTPGVGGTYDAQSTPNVATSSFVLPANTLTIGNTYNVELLFFNRVDVDDEVSVAGAFGFATYTTALNFQIQAVSAIPEPSTYAALVGVAALGFAAWHRRRTAA